ncbi:MAG TPA: carbon-nitrogen hydrolase family protein [Acetobacteraceae bacterium]|nr:carbon-nitrogen hydrolase family protein [Acetobacteraceae bacterium]
MTPVRLGLLAWPVERMAGLSDYAAKLDRLVGEAAGAGAELLVMPEYACMELAAAFCAQPDANGELRALCERTEPVLEAMRRAAMRHRVWLVPGSLPVRQGDAVRNRAPLITPFGTMAFQDKRVMTRFEAEEWGVAPGADPSVFETPWGRIGIAICYDAEFPALVRAQVLAGAWLVLVPTCTDTMAGFNRVRLAARARAVENQCFVAIAPTVGAAPWSATLDANRGYAAVFGPVDRGFPEDGILARGALDAPGWVFADLDPARLDAVRATGGVLNHRDWPPEPPACPVQSPA